MKIATHSSTKKLLQIFIICFYACLILGTAHASVLLDRIVAVVENDVITASELRERINVIRAQAGDKSINLPDENTLTQQVLQRMIIERLQVDWGRQRGINIDDISLDQAMRNLAQRNQLNLDEFRNALLQQGIDYIAFRDQVRTEMTIGQVVRRAVESNIKISASEIDLLLESQEDSLDTNAEYRIAHILIQLPQDPTPSDIETAKSKIENIHKQATEGESFTQLAIAHSQAQDALEGGDLGWRNKNQLPDVFSRQLNNMKPGGISETLRSSSGFHIFRILDMRGNDKIMVEQVLARHILIRTNAVRSDEQVKQDLNSLRSRITNGEDFSELARAHSEDPGSAANGGELGWTAPSVFAPAFREVVEKIPPNELSNPFKSRFGWHILQVIDKREHDNSDEARRNQAREFIRQRKLSEETELWLRQLRDESYVENRLNPDSE
ncbi:MAG: peptidylprolyl isomerase [Gammaproteobacteria bacterium]|nr:peptidylprolyl isomerase [Gammaproteobacteria bacterium]